MTTNSHETPAPDHHFLFTFAIGSTLPGWKYPFEGGSMAVLFPGIQLLVSMPMPRLSEKKAFKKLCEYGIYTTPQFPHGLILWRFDRNVIFESPFNPRVEEASRPDEMRFFNSGDSNMLTRYLINERGTVLDFVSAKVQMGFINRLKEIWSDPLIDWSTYQMRLEEVRQKPVLQLWGETNEKWN